MTSASAKSKVSQMPIPEPAPPPVTEQEIAGFCHAVAQRLQAGGVTACLVGGQACARYNLAQFSKDSDWLILEGDPAQAVAAISEMLSPHRTRPLYSIAAGAPFAENWAKHGWSSHIYFPDRQGKPGARLDLFGRIPRAGSVPRAESWPAIGRHVLACSKKTQREKDWPFVHQLGLQMCKGNDPAGLLHLQDAGELRRQMQRLADLVSPALCEARPLLRIAAETPELAETVILAERELWKRADRIRLSFYLDAWEAYGNEIARRPECRKGPLLEQHRILLDIAADLLPQNPLAPLGENPSAEIRRMAFGHVQSIFPQASGRWFPDAPAQRLRMTRPAQQPTVTGSPLTVEEMAPWQGEANAELSALPLPELLLEIARRQIDFDTPDDLSWPTEYGSGTWNP